MMFQIIDESDNQVLFVGSLDQCEKNLCYFLNHGHDAYLMEEE